MANKLSLTDMLKEQSTEELKQRIEVALNTQPLLEMAKLNLKDGGKSEFPSNAYRIWVQGDGSANKPAHLHIRSTSEDFEIKVYIKNCSLWEVITYGKRKHSDNFSDILKKLASWFKKKTLMPGRTGTNYDAALNEYEACNS